MNKVKITKMLKENVISVVFEKKDGTERTMACTLLDSVIPETAKPKEPSKESPPNLVKAFDVEAEGWRSFRVDSVKSISKV